MLLTLNNVCTHTNNITTSVFFKAKNLFTDKITEMKEQQLLENNA